MKRKSQSKQRSRARRLCQSTPIRHEACNDARQGGRVRTGGRGQQQARQGSSHLRKRIRCALWSAHSHHFILPASTFPVYAAQRVENLGRAKIVAQNVVNLDVCIIPMCIPVLMAFLNMAIPTHTHHPLQGHSVRVSDTFHKAGCGSGTYEQLIQMVHVIHLEEKTSTTTVVFQAQS